MAVDPISQLLFDFNLAPLTDLGRFLDIATYPILFIAWLFILLSRDKRSSDLKQKAQILFVSVLLVGAAVQFTKMSVNSTRPCVDFAAAQEKIDCPSDGAFPSGHSALTAVFIPFALGSWLFPASFLFYLVVAFSRIYLGVHTLYDVVGGTLIGIIGYFVVDSLMRGKESFVGIGPGKKYSSSMEKEAKRKFVHIAIGLFMIASFMVFDSLGLVELFMLLVFGIFLIGLMILNQKLLRRKISIVDFLLGELERPGAIPGYGSLWLVVGLLISLVFLHDRSEILATLVVLAVADSAAPIFGSRGRMQLFYNHEKTLEGSIAFFLLSLLSYLFIGPIALLFALFLTLVESLPLFFDDNLLIPAAAILFFAVL